MSLCKNTASTKAKQKQEKEKDAASTKSKTETGKGKGHCKYKKQSRNREKEKDTANTKRKAETETGKGGRTARDVGANNVTLSRAAAALTAANISASALRSTTCARDTCGLNHDESILLDRGKHVASSHPMCPG
jgi:hypothetical protein